MGDLDLKLAVFQNGSSAMEHKMSDHKWMPIQPLSEKERQIDLADITPLYEAWHIAKERLDSSSPSNLEMFQSRLIRRLNIETGILEHLYDLDRGTTEALVTKGFIEELITRDSTDVEPSRLIDILRDHEAAIQLVMDCVAGNRELTKGVIHELHVILTRNQETTFAVDTIGRRVEISLLRGRFKEQPNNPKRPDGTLHEYCPPSQVASEIDNLLKWFSEYGDEDPILVSAWLHHRFAQIHPYQDGNGRVVRVLTTLILLRAELLPLVIDRDLRLEYINALELADQGELVQLASLFARLEKTAILQALSIDADTVEADERRLTSAVIESLSAKFERRKKAQDEELRRVNVVAKELREQTRRILDINLSQLKESVTQIARAVIRITDGGPEYQNAHWYKFEVIQTAQQTNKFANFDEEHFFTKASIRVERERLIFVTSFHHIGRDLSGVMEATAFAQLESYEASEDRERVSQDFFPCSLEPFVFTRNTKVEEISTSYERWLDSAIAIAIKEFGDRL